MHFTDIFNKDFKEVLDNNFTEVVTENVAPYLYFLIKTIRPKNIMEIGAGYSSVFFAKALADIVAENKIDQKIIDQEKAESNFVRRKNILNEKYEFNSYEPKLYIIDNFSKKLSVDTARPVERALKSLSLDKFVEFFEADAFNLQSVYQIVEPIKPIDFVFLDFGGRRNRLR